MGVISSIEKWAQQRARRFVTWALSGVGADMILSSEEVKEHKLVALARRYYAGDHDVKLTERQKEWMQQHGSTVRFTVNHCPTVVDSVVERLNVIGTNTPDAEQGAEDEAGGWVWRMWKRNRMDAKQRTVYRMAERDGEAFVMVDYDQARGQVRWLPHQRYVDESAGGDGYGMWMEYPQGDMMQEPERAVKQWSETYVDERGKEQVRVRRTVYYPDRIERYVRGRGGEWEPFEETAEDGTVTPSKVAWVDGAGRPLGIPVAHFYVPGRTSALSEIIPLQDMLNKAWLDIMAAVDTTGFGMVATLGFIPTTDGRPPESDGSNLMKIAPGQWFGTLKPPSEAAIQQINPASLQPLLETEDRIVVRIASVSDTPLSRFMTSRQIAAEGTLKQQEAPLLAKCKERMTLYGNAWEDVFAVSMRLAVHFGGEELDPDLTVEVVWDEIETRNDMAYRQALLMEKQMGVTDDKLQEKLGYTKDEIAAFRRRNLLAIADNIRQMPLLREVTADEPDAATA